MVQTIHSALSLAKTLVFDPCKLVISGIQNEKESQEYNACTFHMNGLHIHFRTAKITPTKTGQFVTFWKRTNDGPIQPYDTLNLIDFLVVDVQKDHLYGQFVFPKEELCARGIISNESKEGKRAMRVYPSWDKTESNQAKKTQTWQLKFFFEMHEGKSFDISKVRALYGANAL